MKHVYDATTGTQVFTFCVEAFRFSNFNSTILIDEFGYYLVYVINHVKSLIRDDFSLTGTL